MGLEPLAAILLGTLASAALGGVFVVCVLAFREGVVGVLARRLGRPL